MYETQVEAGGARLDEMGPSDWVNLVDVDTLSMTSSYKCVLGQLYGELSIGVAALDLDGRDITRIQKFGFCSNFDGTHESLADAWRDYINTRRQVHE